MQPSDYSILATAERSREAVSYWRGCLGGIEPFPLSAPRGGIESGRRALRVCAGARGHAALAKLARDDAGRFTVLTAAVALGLARFFNRDRIVIQTPPIAGGDTPLNAERSVPLVFDVPERISLRDLLHQAARAIESGYEHQDFPVAAMCRQERGLELAAIAPFSVSSRAVHDLVAAPATAVQIEIVDLEAAVFVLHFDPAAIEPFIVEGFAQMLPGVIDALADLATITGDVPRLSDVQRAMLAAEWEHQTPAPAYRSVVDLFEDRVRATPSAVALRFEHETLTFADLNARANRLAHTLVRAHGGVARPVAIWMDRSPWMAVAVLGVLKAGLPYLPIDTECPVERAAFMLRDADAAAVLVDAPRAALTIDCPVLRADREFDGSPEAPRTPIASEALAYLIYTSGSTGQPKACAVEHRNLSNYLQWAGTYYWSTPGEGTMALFTPLSFDLTVPSLFCPLLRGTSLTIYPQSLAIDEMLRRQFAPGSGIDTVKLTPSHIHLLAAFNLRSTDVQLAIAGGEALTARHVETLRRLNPRMRIVNEYGPTEATVGCIVKDIADDGVITIGRPIAGMRAYVMDEQQRLLPIGVRGEIVVAGASVARGYHGRDALTARHFLPDPFAGGSRMYRTGDTGRLLPDGEFECAGRIDDQLKVRGYRVEPGEIEDVIRRAGAREAVVIARDEQLVAYVAPATVDRHALHDALTRTLPGYMVPGAIVPLDALPLTANGKVDRARLPAPSHAEARAIAEPRTPHERGLAAIWADAFRVPQVGIHDDFYELGGHSLLALTMMQRIHGAFGVDVSITEMLEHRTIAALAGVVAAKQAVEERPIAAVPASADYAVSHGQRRLWIISRIEDDSPAYNVSAAFELRGPLDIVALQDAFDALVARHESLRTVFITVNDEPRQRVLPPMRVAIDRIAIEAGTSGFAETAAAHARAPFDLRLGPLLRVTLFQHAPEHATLLLTLHHIVSDGWSMRVLIGDVVRLYDARRTGAAAALPPLQIQYKDFAAWQRAELASDAMRRQRDYWMTALAGTPPLMLPADFERSPAAASRGHRHYTRLDAALTRELKALGARHGASLFMTLTALVKALLHRHSGQTDIAVGSPIAGRTRAELAPQIGFYVNTLVLRDDVRGDEPFARLLDRVARTATGAYEHQDFPFDRLVEELDLVRDVSRAPLFDVMVTYDVEPEPDAAAAGLVVSPLRVDNGVSKFDLTFAFADAGDGLDLEIEYRDDLFLSSRIHTLASHFTALARGAAADAAAAIEAYDLGSSVPPGVQPRGSHRASSAASAAAMDGSIAPRDARELALVSALETVLGRRGIGVADNFFFAGGDSIKAIQLAARLGRDGWQLRVRDVFEAPRIDLLARRLAPAAARVERAPAEGDVPLTPIQRWFFLTQPEARHHYNQSVMLRFETRLDAAVVRDIGRELVQHHDALRLRFHTDAGAIRQAYGGAYDPVHVHDLRNSATPQVDLARLAGDAQASLDIEQGPLARVVLFQLPEGDRLLAAVHHLAIDGVSWRILLEDLRVALAQRARGDAITLGERTDSYQAWARAHEAAAADAALERAWWDEVDNAPVVALPGDGGGGPMLESGAGETGFVLDAEATGALRSRVHRAYNTRTSDVLLTALAIALGDWAGPGAVRVDLEAHGRDAMPGLDVSRTVGWFTTLYPVVIDLGTAADPGEQLKAVKEQLRRTPGRGAGYGLLRGGRPSGADVLFNFLGQFDTDIDGFDIASEPRGAEFGPGARMTHPLVLGGWIAEGRLHLTIRYAPARYSARAIARLAEAWQRALALLIAHCRERTTVERTLSDFRYRDAGTAALVARLGADRVEDVYPLSPVQAGMLYHTALAPGTPLYVEQFTCAITGVLDEAAFRNAWDAVMHRHTALRTGFEMQGVEPVQVVYAAVDAPWAVLDWRTLPAPEQQRRLDAFAREDRARPLDAAAAPVMRFALIRLGDERWRFFWTWHHALLDGWSTAIVLQDVFAIYQSAVTGATRALESARPYGEYIDWLRACDATAGTEFWRSRLAGVTAPTPLPGSPAAPVEGAAFAVDEFALDARVTASLEAAARAHHLTLNTIARGLWARLLGDHARSRDVVFGATVAGRPASLDGVETMAGLFINTVPIRVRLDEGLPAAEWLRHLQEADAEIDQHAHVSLADIQRLSGVPARAPLFDTILVFENYPVDESIEPSQAGIVVSGITVAEQTNYPLTLSIVPGERLTLRASYDTSRYSPEAARALLGDLAARFDAFARDPLARPGRERAVVYEHPALSVEAAQRMAAALCARYSANEDLLWSVDGITGPGDTGSGGAVTDLAFSINAHDSRGVTIAVSSASGRFDQAFLRRTESHLSTLAAAAAASPDTALEHLPVLPPDERRRVLEAFNDTRRDWNLDRTIAQHFEGMAEAHPERVALVVPAHGRDESGTGEEWTYAALNARANQLAHLLTRVHGVGPGTLVGVLAERSSDMVLALMAILKAGGAYVPLDPEYPPSLLAFMVEDAAPAVILAQEAFAHLVTGAAAPVIVFEHERAAIAGESSANLPSRVTGSDLAYVIYTSGSTGRPKGAMNTHRGIANRLLWMQDAFGLTADDRVLQKTPFSFDVSVWEFFWPLMTGARLVMAKPGGHRDASYLVSLIQHAGITTLHFVPSMLQAFVDEPSVERCTSIARVIASGEAITPALLARYLARVPAPLHNLYGPTEAAVDVTAWTCSAADTTGMVPIGRPIANIQLYILDARLEPVPEGVTGELFLGGIGVGRGYLGRPELTAERFIANPFGQGRLYRTGDLARYRAGGVVDFLGRIDHQVKIRGFRIELGEIESALIAQPGVREAAVLARDDHEGAKQLVAYVAVDGADASTPAVLRDALRQMLPAHMVPPLIMPIDALPKLPNGKIDRKALPAPTAMPPAAHRVVAPRDALERTLARIWCDVLARTSVGVTDDFFELGGHSLSAIRVMAGIQAALGRTLPLSALLQHTTIERLAVALGREHDAGAWRPLVEIRAGGPAAPLFLFPGAGGNVIYFHPLARHLSPGRPLYGMQAIGLDGVTPPLTSIEAMAAANIAEMRRVWPSGPYYLAGHSFGGRVALEAARQLQAAGAHVALLAVLDTAAPIFEPVSTGEGWTDAHWLERIAREIEMFFGVTLPVTLDDLMPLGHDAQLALVIDQLQRAGAWAPGSDPAQLAGYLQVYKTNSQMPFAPYETGVPIPIALFKALAPEPATDATPASLTALLGERAWGWDRFAAGEVAVFEVPGSHLSMLADPHAATLAARLDEAIASAGASPGLSPTVVSL